jgi:hypothetical protein
LATDSIESAPTAAYQPSTKLGTPPIPVYALMIVLYAITSAEVIDLTNGGIDLGRHLKDGELLLSPAASQILHTNFYSYTQPDREFVNHHWLAGIVFHAVYKLGGFPGLNAFYILLGELTLVPCAPAEQFLGVHIHLDGIHTGRMEFGQPLLN